MPGNEDLELLWSAHGYAPEMPVIIYTGQPSLHSAITSIQLSVTAYLIKPVPFVVLLQHVKTSIGRQQRLRSLSTSGERLHYGQDELAQIDLLTGAIQETIEVLQTTRSAFKSKKLAALRRKLERLIAGAHPEWDDASNSDP
jgi:DNA-binding NtrC family response regulator